MNIKNKELASKIIVIKKNLKQAKGKKTKAKESTAKESTAKESKESRSIETLFRNSLRSNLDLTSLADSKASVLISVNGFILTVILTASGLYLSDPNMMYPFIMIMLTALISILLGTMAIRPRDKAQLIKKEHLHEFESVGYFQDMAEASPNEYLESVRNILKNKEEVHTHIIKHVHILGSEIKVKYYWLKKAYTAFAIGLSLSALLMIIAMFQTIGLTPHKEHQFSNIYEPSGAISLNDGKVLLVEDESQRSLQLVEINKDGTVKELKSPKMSQQIKYIFENKVSDLEGATSNGDNTIYTITSHTTTKSGKRKNPREQIVRFSYKDGEIFHVKLYHGLLNSLKTVHPKLENRDNLSRKKQINIEGLSWDKENKSLLIGLRSPLIENKAVVVAIKNPNAIFDDKENAKLDKPFLLDLEGAGIRGMSWDEEKHGYWIIAGDVGKRKKEFSLWFWDKKNNSVKKSKKHDKIGFAEGITHIANIGILVVKDDGSVATHGANYILIKDEK